VRRCSVRLTVAPIMAALCHYSMCRRANAAPAVAWAMYTESRVEFAEKRPGQFAFSPGCDRGFCPDCGSQIRFSANSLPGLIHITVGTFDEPNRVPPELHYRESKRLERRHLGDRLPRYPVFPPSELPPSAA
jgi:hypothetical protein